MDARVAQEHVFFTLVDPSGSFKSPMDPFSRKSKPLNFNYIKQVNPTIHNLIPPYDQNEIQRSGFKLIGVQVPLRSVFVAKGAHGTTGAPGGGAHRTTLEVPGETLI